MGVGSPTVLPSASSQADDIYEIYLLCYARMPERRVHDNFILRDMHDGPMQLDFNLWIVRNAHRTILVDTGFGPRAAAARGRPLDHDPIEALGKIGLDPDEIEDVVITHLHFDHAGNIGRFGKARFHVQDAEVEFATGRCMCEHFLRRPFDVEDVVNLIRCTFASRVRFHDGDVSPWPGISLHLVPGHTKGLQAVRVNTLRGPVLLASDASHYYTTLLRRGPFAITVDAEATLRSYDRLMGLAGSLDRIIPGHDPKVRCLYPALSVNGVMLSLLHQRPAQHDPEALAAYEIGE